jgi:SET domain-containing protein
VVLGRSSIRGAGTGVFATTYIPKGKFLGRYLGVKRTEEVFFQLADSRRADPDYAFDVHSGAIHFILDATHLKNSNWTRFMNCSRNDQEENVIYQDKNGQISFYARKSIYPGEELLFYYGEEYAKRLGIGYVSAFY